MNKNLKILMSGGGTGGHIFPAIAVADEIKKRFPSAEFLFVGANGKMEMEKVPQAGYQIVGLNIAGFDRGNLFKNISLPAKVIVSLLKARETIKDFQPDFAIGTGGFASGPALFVAAKLGVPIFLQEQNSLPGKTNIYLSKKAKVVFTAYPNMGKFFQGTETIFSGNPVRKNIIADAVDIKSAKEKLGLDPQKLTILSVGGSLGSRTLNTGWMNNLGHIIEKDYQLIWQTGRNEFNDLNNNELVNTFKSSILLTEFISDMALAYSAADVIVSRAGAIAISELAMTNKAILLVPFPFASEDHQTKNAVTLVDKNAAKMVKDSEMKEQFLPALREICENENLRSDMAQNLNFFAKPKATEEIVDEILKTLKIDI